MQGGSSLHMKKPNSTGYLTEDEGVNDVAVWNGQSHRHTISDCSVECSEVEEDSDGPGAGASPSPQADSGIADKTTSDGDLFQTLEGKVDMLSEMFKKHLRWLNMLKEDIRSFKSALEKAKANQNQIVTDVVKKAVQHSNSAKSGASNAGVSAGINSGARSLLQAIETRLDTPEDKEIKDALASFLQSEELKKNMVAATAESLKGAIGEGISQDVSSLYLPLLEHSNGRLVRSVANTVEETLLEVQDYSDGLSKSLIKMKLLRRSIDRHQKLLDTAVDPRKNLITTLKCSVEELLHKEIKQWRQKVLNVFSPQLAHSEAAPGLQPLQDPLELLEHPVISPLQPTDPRCTFTDQLLCPKSLAEEISAEMKSGKVNSAFARALCALNLSLVVRACREAERLQARVFSPRCSLRQDVLLALLQQLSTDMLFETQLKCRYLEDAIINLDPSNPTTRSHLPLVVREVRNHLTRFLSSYPCHGDARRIAVIIIAANGLLKKY